jgi:hypothetical protein
MATSRAAGQFVRERGRLARKTCGGSAAIRGGNDIIL